VNQSLDNVKLVAFHHLNKRYTIVQASHDVQIQYKT